MASEKGTEREINIRTISGKIRSREQTIRLKSQIYHLEGNYVCEEMIGRVITEEIGETNGKAD